VALFVAGQVHRVDLADTLLTGVSEARVAQIARVVQPSVAAARVAVGGAVSHPPPATGRVSPADADVYLGKVSCVAQALN
jgi:hypothetical protein